MSAETIHFRQLSRQPYATNEVVHLEVSEVSKDSDVAASRVSSEFVYRVLETPHPTPDDIRREYFLLDCD
jgi:hypothetical protein